MPHGKVHVAFELGTLPAWVALGAVLDVGRTSLVFFSGAYVAASLFLSPDLDLAESDVARRWRGARFLWRPYALLFRHRGISHSLVFGPLTRLLYLALIGGAVGVVLHVVTGISFPYTFSLDLVLPVLVGVFAPQVLHVTLDQAVTRVRRWW